MNSRSKRQIRKYSRTRNYFWDFGVLKNMQKLPIGIQSFKELRTEGVENLWAVYERVKFGTASHAKA